MGQSRWRKGAALLFILLLHTFDTMTEEPLLIVTDPWPPYTLEVRGKITGIDADITNAEYCQGWNYLAFSKKSDSEKLSARFGLHYRRSKRPMPINKF